MWEEVQRQGESAKALSNNALESQITEAFRWSRVKCAELECDKTFVNKYTMAKHYQNVHWVKSLHSCDHCHWKTPDRNTLLFHLLKSHDQRQLLVAPLRQGMDLSELEFSVSNQDQ